MARTMIAKKEEDLTSMSLGELVSKIRILEQKYSMSYEEFMRTFRDEEATFEELVDQFDWETYWEEFQRRLKQTGKLRVKASSIEEYQQILTPLRMKVYSALLGSGEMTASQISKQLRKSLGSVVNALAMLTKFGIVVAEQRGGRKSYRALVKEIVITA